MVSDIQERQLTTNKKNITAYRVNGTFDDCQNMVKNAFIDKGSQTYIADGNRKIVVNIDSIATISEDDLLLIQF
mgnify:CR=1 FL=1